MDLYVRMSGQTIRPMIGLVALVHGAVLYDSARLYDAPVGREARCRAQ